MQISLPAKPLTEIRPEILETTQTIDMNAINTYILNRTSIIKELSEAEPQELLESNCKLPENM